MTKQTQFALGNQAFRDQDYVKAVRHYRAALLANPDLRALILTNLGLAAEQLGIPEACLIPQTTQPAPHRQAAKPVEQTEPVEPATAGQPSEAPESDPAAESGQPATNGQPPAKPVPPLVADPDLHRALSILVDARWYADNYRLAEHRNPLNHFLQHGWRRGHKPNPLFETRWYLARYPEVADAGLNPLLHYLLQGAAEGKHPGRLFDTGYYLEANPDVAQSGINPLQHYLKTGIVEQRRPHRHYQPLVVDADPRDRHQLLCHIDRYLDTLDRLGLPLIPQLPLTPLESGGVPANLVINPADPAALIARTQAASGHRCALVSVNYGGRDVGVPGAAMADADCYLFTDRPAQTLPPWRSLQASYWDADPKRMALYIKTHLWRFFSGYDQVLWVDHNLIPLFNALGSFIDQLQPPMIASYRHWARDCLYAEAEAVVQSKREAPEIVARQIERYRRAGLPEAYGLFETNVLFLDLREPRVHKLLQDWWLEIRNGAKRCQLSFTYVLWKNGLQAQPLEPPPISARNSRFFLYLNHDKKTWWPSP